MTDYMETGKAPMEKLGPAIRQATADGELIPVMFCDAETGAGIKELLHALITFGPSPERGLHRHLIKGSGEKVEDIVIAHDPAGPVHRPGL
jgi:elongation factor G